MLQSWQQIYDPMANIWLSSAIALIPIVFFFLALAIFRLKGSVAATITVALALLVALFAYQMPAATAFASLVYGFFMACGQLRGLLLVRYFYIKFRSKPASLILSVLLFYRLPKINVYKCCWWALPLVRS